MREMCLADSSPGKRPDIVPLVKSDRGPARVRQRYHKQTKEELILQLLCAEQAYA